MTPSSSRRTAALDQILEITVLLHDDMTRALARDGLTESRTHLLWVLLHQGPATQRALADALRVSARNVTGLVDGLVAGGFVTREPHPQDRRATHVTLTPHGEDVMHRMAGEHERLAHDLFGDLTDRQFAGLTAGLEHVGERLRVLVSAAEGSGTSADAGDATRTTEKSS